MTRLPRESNKSWVQGRNSSKASTRRSSYGEPRSGISLVANSPPDVTAPAEVRLHIPNLFQMKTVLGKRLPRFGARAYQSVRNEGLCAEVELFRVL